LDEVAKLQAPATNGQDNGEVDDLIRGSRERQRASKKASDWMQTCLHPVTSSLVNVGVIEIEDLSGVANTVGSVACDFGK
jgi:hypothetical protein